MREVREILRLRIGSELSARQVAASCKVSVGTVIEYEKRVREAGLSWPLPDETDDDALLRIVRSWPGDFRHNRPLPQLSWLLTEMKKPRVTLHLLWLEYRETQPDGYGYTQFCHYDNQAKAKLPVTLRQDHKAGEKLFTDYAGDTLPLIDPRTGETRPVYVFVAVLGAGSYTYAEATLDMTLPSWIDSHVRSFEYIGGVPRIVVPDNTRCAVIRPDRYEPDLNPTFAEMASHYGTAVIPARVRKPRDKAKVEAGVLLVERWIMAALRNRTFFSLEEVNEAIGSLLLKLNTRKMKKIDATRLQLFERLDKPAPLPLPPTRYQYAEWRTAKVSVDYHISAHKHFYSVTYQLVGEQVDVRLGSTTKACRMKYSVRYFGCGALLSAMTLARADGSYSSLLRGLAKTDLLVIDDWGIYPFTQESARDIFEVLEDRSHRGSVVVVSQIPVDAWYDIIAAPTIADAILDRLVHNAYRLEMTGDSMRRKLSPLTATKD